MQDGGGLQYVFSGEMLSDSPNLALLGWGGGGGGKRNPFEIQELNDRLISWY